MFNQFTKLIVGAVVLIGALALLLPALFNENNQGTITEIDTSKVPQGNNQKAQQASSEQTQNVQVGVQNGFSEGGQGLVTDNDGSYAEDGEPLGYNALLDEGDGAPAPSESDDGKVTTGVVVGGQGANNGSFVKNPTATGRTPAEAARIQKENAALAKEQAALAKEQSQAQARAEAERRAALKAQQEAERQKQQAALRAQQEAERQRQQAALKAQQEAEKQKQQAALKAQQDAEKQKQQAALKAQQEAERQKQQAALKAQQEAEKQKQQAALKAQQEAEKQKQLAALKAQQEAEKQKQAAAKRVSSVPKGRYLQVGVYSSQAQAQKVVNSLRSQKIRISNDGSIGSGFGYKIDSTSRPGLYYVLVGPTTGDKVLQSIKPQVNKVSGGSSFVVSR